MSENTNPMDEVVERVRGKVAPDGRAWLPCDLDGNTIPEVSDDLTKLLAAYQSVREELNALRESINVTECVDGCDSIAHADGCTTTDLALHLANTQRQIQMARSDWMEVFAQMGIYAPRTGGTE
jgi:hypothetical protein